MSNGPSRRQSLGGAENLQKFQSNGSFSKKAPASQMKHSFSTISCTAHLQTIELQVLFRQEPKSSRPRYFAHFQSAWCPMLQSISLARLSVGSL